MFKNYLKIALRNIKRSKMLSFINIFGLSIGMASCIMILFWVQDELSYDRFHEAAENIYRIVQYQPTSSGEKFPVAVTSGPLSAKIKEMFPEIIYSVRYKQSDGILTQYGDKKFFANDVSFVEPDFLKIFAHSFIKGDAETALNNPQSLVLTESTAHKYFEDEDPIGKVIKLINNYDFTVTGLIADSPANSHFKYDYLATFSFLIDVVGYSNTWGNNNFYTYFKLGPGSDHVLFMKKFDEFQKSFEPLVWAEYVPQKVVDIHLRSDFVIDLDGHSESKSGYVYIFSFIAFFILLIACINFVNLSTARSANRAKEVGLRKVVGAYRKSLIAQFLGESVIQAFLSFILALIIVFVSFPLFNSLAGKALAFDLLGQPLIILSFIVSTLVIGLLSGVYPAFFLSSFMPCSVLKVKMARSGSSGFRKILVVTQFALSMLLIAGSLIVFEQLNFMKGNDPGFDKDQLIYFSLRGGFGNDIGSLREELLRDPNIQNVTVSTDIPTYTVHSTAGISWEGMDPDVSMMIHRFAVDQYYIESFGLEIVEGRFFSEGFQPGFQAGYILNEAAIKQMGMEDPIGKRFTFWQYEGTIIGVVKDFHFKSLHEEIEPLILYSSSEANAFSYAFVRINPANVQQTLSYIQKTVQKINPEYPIECQFLDEEFAALYRSEEKISSIVNLFTLLAIFISCLGLFAMASFMAEQRIKELGIRKVLGASVSNLVTLLSLDFLKWVGFAAIVALPVTYYLAGKWLEDFAYRIDVNIGVLILSALFAALFAVLTVSYQAIRAARMNPVDTLRSE